MLGDRVQVGAAHRTAGGHEGLGGLSMVARPGPGVAFVVLCCVLPVGIAGCSVASTGVSADDQRLAFCLAPERRQELVDTAVNLGVARASDTVDHLSVHDREMAVDKWRGPEFERACDALMAASRNEAPVSGTPGWLTDLLGTVKAILLLLAGAAFTMVTGGMRDAGTRRRLLAAELRGAAENFAVTSRAFLDAQLDPHSGAPDDRIVRDRRQELLAKLHEVRALYRDPPDHGRSLTVLNGPLSESLLLRDWVLGDKADQVRRADTLRQDLTTLSDHVAALAGWLQRSLLARLGGVR
jgi:hypothetical protein